MSTEDPQRITWPGRRGALSGRLVTLEQRMQLAELRIAVVERCVVSIVVVMCLAALGALWWRWPWQ